MFQKGRSGNPTGRRKGSVSQKVALKNLLEEVFFENRKKAKAMLVEMLDDPRDFRRLCELKAQFEVKEIPQKLDGELSANITVNFEKDASENHLQAPRFAVPSIQ